MSVYQGPVGAEFGEFEGGEYEGGEYEGGEYEGGEFEGGELFEYEGHEQFLGSILGSVLGGEAGPLSEQEEIELASELLEITSEQELEQFLGNVFKKVSRGVGTFIKSPVGRALGGVLKNVAKKALPVVGGALGSMVAPGIGTAIGSKLGSLAGGLFEVQLEGKLPEQAEYEVARRYVGLAASAARNAALARPRPGVNPVTVARAAVTRAARTHAPGLYRQMMRSLTSGAGAATRPGGMRPSRRPGGLPVPSTGARPRPFPPRPGFVPGPAVAGVAVAGAPDAAPMGIPDDAFEPVEPAMDGVALSGRWVRRGRKIIVLGV
jgi:uncharacterized protein (DUF697 family)